MDEIDRLYEGAGLEPKLFKFVDENPLVSQGNISEVYQNLSKRHPSLVPDELFNVTFGDKAIAYDLDMQFSYGASLAISELGDLSETYFLVDVGTAQLPALASMLFRKGVDCNLILAGDIDTRFLETSLFFAKSIKQAKEALTFEAKNRSETDTYQIVTGVTLFDGNSIGEDTLVDYLPMPETLTFDGIRNIVYLTRDNPESVELSEIMRNTLYHYFCSGFNVVAQGVNQGRRFAKK